MEEEIKGTLVDVQDSDMGRKRAYKLVRQNTPIAARQRVIGTILYCTVMYCTVHCGVRYVYCAVTYTAVLYCNALYCVVLHRTVMYCNVQ